MMVGKLEFPAGFRFHPTDEELVMHYLCRKCASQSITATIIAEIDLYKYDPWQLPNLALYGEKEWYFFSPRDRKYPNGSRPNRAAGTGYWKATGADKPIGRPKTVGIKKALVFYSGKAPKGVKTNWIMHEYRLANVDRSAGKRNNSRQLDEWVLCRIYNKKGNLEKQQASSPTSESLSGVEDKKPDILTSDMYTMTAQPIQYPVPTAAPAFNNHFYAEQSDSVPIMRPQQPGSRYSDQVWSPEVESKAKWNDDDNNQALNYMNSLSYDMFRDDQFSDPMQDLYSYLHNPQLM